MLQPERRQSLNGNHAAPPSTGGAAVVERARTVFPAPLLQLSPATLLYALSRGQVGGLRPLRLLQWGLVLLAAVWLAATLPGSWWVASAWIVLLIGLQALLYSLRQSDFVSFSAHDPPLVAPARLDVKSKIPTFVTGRLSVEFKEQRFTWLPAFYRTFATREHALICQVAARVAGLPGAAWPEGTPGLWYAFIAPDAIEAVQWGELAFGRNRRPALAVHYRFTPAQQGRKPAPSVSETLYLAFDNERDAHVVLADLLDDWPGVETVTGPKPKLHRTPKG